MESKTFNDYVKVKWLGNDFHSMQILQEFTYCDSKKVHWTVPKGLIIDGASIPRILWSIMGSPYIGKYRRPSVVHDAYCKLKIRSYKDTHKVFKEMMQVEGVGCIKIFFMYWGVKLFGFKKW
jgi:hypothetical protein